MSSTSWDKFLPLQIIYYLIHANHNSIDTNSMSKFTKSLGYIIVISRGRM